MNSVAPPAQREEPVASSSPKVNRSRFGAWLFRFTLAAIVLWLFGGSFSRYGSFILEREQGRDSRVMVGHGRQRLLLGPRYRGTETEQNRSVRSFPKDKLPEHPTRVHSLTFVDLEGSRVSRRIGCALAKEARRAPSLQRIDVRVAGDPFENDVIGDLIFVLENLDLETTAAADIAPVSRPHIVVNAALSHVPELGWAEELGVRQRATVLWDHSTEALYVGSPLSNAIAVAA